MSDIFGSSDLLLASKSPRRQAILRQIGVNFTVIDVNVTELHRDGEKPIDFAVRLSQDKATAGCSVAQNCLPVLGSDTIVVCDGQIMGKPGGLDDAKAMLMLLSGRAHHVVTAVSVMQGGKLKTRWNSTEVTFRQLSLHEIERYWQTGEPQDKAGAYGIQGLGAVFVERIVGSYSSVVGLPVHETVELLKEFSIPWWACPDEQVIE